MTKRHFYGSKVEPPASTIDRLKRFAAGLSSEDKIQGRSSGPLSPVMFAEIKRMRTRDNSVEYQSALDQLEAIALQVRHLEVQCEQILAQVRPSTPEDDALSDFPEFLLAGPRVPD